MVASTCNYSSLGGREECESPEVRSSRPAWSTWWKPVSTKNTKISWAWWQVPVIPAIQETGSKSYLNLGERGCSEPRSHHCPVLARRVKLLLKKQKKRNLLKEIKDLNEWRNIRVHKIRLSVVKMSILFNVIYKFNTTPVKTWTNYCVKIYKLLIKFI